MYVYFVRHGESEGNVANIHQLPETPLSNLGITQAINVSQRLQHLSFDAIVSSDYDRTKHTAQLIQADTTIPFLETPLLREHRLPSVMKGLLVTDPLAQSVRETLLSNANDPEFHHSDEENLSDLIKRAEESLNYISQLPYDRIVAVTHGNFLKCVCLKIVFGKLLTPELVAASFRNLKTTNTGITIAAYDDRVWSLITWNDFAHLAD